MSDDNTVIFHMNDNDSSGSEGSNDSNRKIKREPEVRTFIISQPAQLKSPKIKGIGRLTELNVDDTLDDIEAIIEAGERIVHHVNNISINCCSTSKCGSLFGRCFKIRTRVSDNETKVSVI